ncbi:MAG: YihY/virulence factor BrkB family protein [Gammaproteobacteria bacterium]
MIKELYLFAKSVGLAIRDLVNHEGLEHAGYLSFLLMLTIFPFLVFFMAILGFVGNVELSEKLLEIITHSNWAEFITALKPRIIEITSAPPQSLLTIAIVSAIWTASSIFEGIRTILNKAYRIHSYPAYIFRRMFSILEFIVAIVVISIFLFVLVILPTIWQMVAQFLTYGDTPLLSFISKEGDELRTLLLLVFGFCVISASYYFLPSRRHRLRYTIPGTITVMIAWGVFSWLFKFYLSNFPQVNLIYGSIAGIIIALLFFYVCSIIYIFGAEFNYHLEQTLFKRKK